MIDAELRSSVFIYSTCLLYAGGLPGINTFLHVVMKTGEAWRFYHVVSTPSGLEPTLAGYLKLYRL